MRPGDSIVVTQTEAELLMSDSFKDVASVELTSKIILTPSDVGATDFYGLALPKVGTAVANALRTFAASDVDARQAIIAEALAAAIAERVSPR